MIKMTERYCALCRGTGYYDAPTQTGGYKATKCNHEWEERALNYRFKKAQAKFEEAREEYLYLTRCKYNMEKI